MTDNLYDDESEWTISEEDTSDDRQGWRDKIGRLRKYVFFNMEYTGYYKDGEYHRLDGPARIWNDHQHWYVNGQKIEVSSQQEFEKYLKMKAFW